MLNYAYPGYENDDNNFNFFFIVFKMILIKMIFNEKE